jgi:hypothetical protein
MPAGDFHRASAYRLSDPESRQSQANFGQVYQGAPRILQFGLKGGFKLLPDLRRCVPATFTAHRWSAPIGRKNLSLHGAAAYIKVTSYG